jgi:hypothetical protein
MKLRISPGTLLFLCCIGLVSIPPVVFMVQVNTARKEAIWMWEH